MLRLRDIMTRNVVTLSPDVTIRDAMTLLSTRHISGAPVVSGTDVVGIISSNDLMAFAVELPGAIVEHLDPLGRGELTARDEHALEAELEPTGAFFTAMWDDADADVSVRFDGKTAADWSALDEHTVEEAMTRAPIHTMPDDASLPDAARFMRDHEIHRVLVTDQHECVGIVTPTDIADAVAAHLLDERASVMADDVRFSCVPVARVSSLSARLARR